METKRCVRCASPMILVDDHYECPVCQLQLAAFAFPKEEVDLEEDDEATAQYHLPFQ